MTQRAKRQLSRPPTVVVSRVDSLLFLARSLAVFPDILHHFWMVAVSDDSVQSSGSSRAEQGRAEATLATCIPNWQRDAKYYQSAEGMTLSPTLLVSGSMRLSSRDRWLDLHGNTNGF